MLVIIASRDEYRVGFQALSKSAHVLADNTVLSTTDKGTLTRERSKNRTESARVLMKPANSRSGRLLITTASLKTPEAEPYE